MNCRTIGAGTVTYMQRVGHMQALHVKIISQCSKPLNICVHLRSYADVDVHAHVWIEVVSGKKVYSREQASNLEGIATKTMIQLSTCDVKTLCFKYSMYWPFTIELFYRFSLDFQSFIQNYFFLKVGQYNFGNKILLLKRLYVKFDFILFRIETHMYGKIWPWLVYSY